MTRKSVKQERQDFELEEELTIPSSMKPKRKPRADQAGRDTDMMDAPTVSTSSFPAMPTPSSFAAESGIETPIDGLRRESTAGFARSDAPSAETGLHIVGRRVQVLVDAIHDFRKFSVEHVAQLPELVLVGDQSAGKSSLMGALAEIHLPQSAGCCTRCPAHIKTAPAEEWSCKVSLQQSYSYEPISERPLESKDVTRNRPFPPWKDQDMIEKPFKTIRDKSELENVLRWAQIAILNHNKNHALYIPGTDNFANDERTEAKFSPNVVSVEIYGPGLVPLSFFDLPGIFQNAGQKEDQYLVKVIENLAAKYIRHPQALIICALPMSADPATSRTAKVISDLNAESRCIGVLTKADQLQDGQAHADFESMLRGQEHKIGHGYYVTKLPGQSQRSYDEEYHARARNAEGLFFSTQSPWDSEWIEFRSRFGTSNLAHALSQKFAAQIVESMPDIERKIYLRAREIDSQLQELPELPAHNILHVVLQHLAQFTANMQNLLDGSSSHNDFQSSWRALCKNFRETVLAMKPMITIADPSDMQQQEIINIDDDDDVSVSDSTPTHNVRKRMNDETPSPCDKKAKVDSNSFSDARGASSYGVDSFSSSWGTPRQNGTAKVNGSNPLPHRFATPTRESQSQPKETVNDEPNPFAEFQNAGKNFASIGEIRNVISRYSRTGLPSIVNDQVYNELCTLSVVYWENPLERMIDITLRMLRDQADIILLKVLSKWQQTQLFKQARQHLSTFFDDFETTQRAAATDLFNLETYRLFTINETAFEMYSQQELKVLQRAREQRRAKAAAEKTARQNGKPFRDEGARKQAITQIIKNGLGKDPFEKEIGVAAYVRGYYMTAALRFVDSVCLSIHGKLFKDAREEIFYFLERELGLNQSTGEERCRELMEENATFAARRAALRKEKDSLAKFTERLRQLARDNAALDAESDMA